MRPDPPLGRRRGWHGDFSEETSIDYSAGPMVGVGTTWKLTADLYFITIDGRIYKTQNLPFTPPGTDIASNVQFFTNALDLEVLGFDIVYTTSIEWGVSAS